MKRFVIIDMQYYLGCSRVWMNGSVVGIAAVLMAMGCEVDIVDFNIDHWDDERVQALLSHADYVGISLVGAPYIPGAIALAKRLNAAFPNKPIILGGKVIEKLEPYQFKLLFTGTLAVQYRTPIDLATLLDGEASRVPGVFSVPFVPVWERMGNERLRQYLSVETTLVNAQGCVYACEQCGADRNQKQVWPSGEQFYENLIYLARKAQEFSLQELRFYMSDLDATQVKEKLITQLEVIARVRAETGVDIRVRCLACTKTFVRLVHSYPEFAGLCHRAGMERFGFGIDGTRLTWKEISKPHNDEVEIAEVLGYCQQNDLQAEALLVVGSRAESLASLLQLHYDAIRYAFRYGADIRPHLYKPIPGGDEWGEQGSLIQYVLESPILFHNLDFTACASVLTHPIWYQRWAANAAFVLLVIGYNLLGKTTNSLLLATSKGGFLSRFANVINQYLPADH